MRSARARNSNIGMKVEWLQRWVYLQGLALDNIPLSYEAYAITLWPGA